MFIFGTDVCLKNPPRFVRVAILLLSLYWGIALFIFSKELVTGSMGSALGYPGPTRFFVHYAPQLFFIPWIILNIFRKMPLFRVVPGVAFLAIGAVTSTQFALSFVALLQGKKVSTILPLGVPAVWEAALLLPLFLLVFVTGIMLLQGKKEKAWFFS